MAVRHGITAWNLERRYQGQRDIPLLFPDAEEGLLTLREALMDERFDAIYARRGHKQQSRVYPSMPNRAYGSSILASTKARFTMN